MFFISEMIGVTAALIWILSQAALICAAISRAHQNFIYSAGVMIMSFLGSWYSGILLRPVFALMISAVVVLIAVIVWMIVPPSASDAVGEKQ